MCITHWRNSSTCSYVFFLQSSWQENWYRWHLNMKLVPLSGLFSLVQRQEMRTVGWVLLVLDRKREAVAVDGFETGINIPSSSWQQEGEVQRGRRGGNKQPEAGRNRDWRLVDHCKLEQFSFGNDHHLCLGPMWLLTHNRAGEDEINYACEEQACDCQSVIDRLMHE